MILWAVLLILASARAAHLPSPKHDSSNIFLLFHDETKVSSEAAISRGKRSCPCGVWSPPTDKCAEIRARGGALDLIKGYLKNEPTATPDDTTTEGEWFVQTMEELTNGVKELLAISDKMKSSPSLIPAEEYIKMRQTSEETKRKFQLKLDQAMKNAKQHGYQCSHEYFMEIETDWQEMLEKMKKTMQDLHRSINEREILSLIASDVSQEKYDEAVQKFLILDNDTLLNLVVARAYGIGKVPNILKFVEKVSPSKLHHIQAVNKLVDEIIAHNDTSSPMSLLISSHVRKQFPVSSISVENKPMLEKINSKLSALELSVVGSLAKQIASGRYQPTLDFQKKYGMEDQLLNDIIIRAYDFNQPENILMFIDKLPVADLNCALNTFINEVDAHNDTSSSISLLILGHYNKRPAEADVGAKCKTLFDSARLSALKLSVVGSLAKQIAIPDWGSYQPTVDFLKKYGMEDQLLNDIIIRAYDFDPAARILIFIEALPIIYRICALNTFLNEVDAHNDTSSSISLLMLYHYNKRLAEAAVGAKCKIDSARIQQLSATKLSVMDTWVEQIRKGCYEGILDFDKKYGQDGVIFDIAEDVVKRAYLADRDVIMNLVYLSNHLTGIEAKISMNVELYNQMKSTSQVTLKPVVRIAYQLKKITQIGNYKLVNDFYKRKLNSAWDEFPNELKAIVSGDAVCLKDGSSASDNRYLYVKNHVDNYKDYVDTGILTGDGGKKNAISHRWKFQVEEKEGEFYFYIKSDIHDYLYAWENYYGEKSHTWRNGKHVMGDEWDLVDYDWKNGKFFLRMRLRNRFLTNDGAYISNRVQHNYVWKIETKCT